MLTILFAEPKSKSKRKKNDFFHVNARLTQKSKHELGALCTRQIGLRLYHTDGYT